MGRKKVHRRRQGRRSRGDGRRNSGWSSPLLWAAGVVVVIGILLLATRDAAATHPTPRPDVGPEHVVSAQRYASYPRIAAVYGDARAVAHVLDGIYCYCRCSEHSGHYSLLDCFRDDHAARCDICLSEAAMAHTMSRDGASLDDIRRAVDTLYGT